MTMDFLFLLPLIFFAMLGFRDGIVRKLTAIGTIIVAMFVAQFLQNDLAKVLRDHAGVEPADAPLRAYFLIFFSLLFIQALLYRVLAKAYKIGGIVDRVIGAALGLLEGGLILSVILVMLSLQGIPDRRTVRDSRLYGTLVSLAPMITDLASTALPEAKESLEKLTSPAPEAKESENVKYLKGVQEGMKASSSKIDSIAKRQKK